jgi:voltage-gated potassium channel
LKKESLSTGYIAFGLLIFVVIIGVSGYLLMGFTFTEAFFMTIITIATVGFKAVHELEPHGMWITAIHIIFSFVFLLCTTTFGRYLIDGVFKNYYKDNKVKRKSRNYSNHVVICGYGSNGMSGSK